MRLIHWSDEPLEKIDECTQQTDFYKPCGLWVSDESAFSWQDVCHIEGRPCGKFGTPIKLLPKHNILILHTAEQVLGFSREFGIIHGTVDWKRVAQHYDGIIITPYHPELWLEKEASWYYFWECAGGCIWRPQHVSLGNVSV